VGKSAASFDSAEGIAAFLAEKSLPGDIVVVMSNGSFDGLCDKLLSRLSKRANSPETARA